MNYLIISSSLNPKSRSRLLALIAFNELKNMGVSVEWLDLDDHSIPLCDGDAWSNIIFGFLCAAGGKASYMSVMSLANSLMLDFRCLIIPRFVYTVSDDFTEKDITDPKVKTQVKELAKELIRICTVLNKHSKF